MTNHSSLAKIFEIIETEINKDHSKNKVLNYQKPKDLSEKLNLELPVEGEKDKGLFESIGKYLDYSVDTSHPHFANQLWSGRNYPALIGEFLTSLRNTSVYTFETAPAGVIIEEYMINYLSKLAGFENGDGTFLTGSSNANLVSLIVARNTKFPEIKTKGVYAIPELVFFVSEEAHYSFDKAANILGIGEDNLIKVKADENFRMIPEELEKAVKKAKSEGKVPFYVSATAGTTEAGNFDPLDEIREIADKYEMWMHTDAAWGGALLLSEKHKHKLGAIEKSDSIAWDAHKMMGIPLICSVILLREKGYLYPAVSDGNSDYLFHEHEFTDNDLGRKSIQCGRRIDSLKLWLSFKYYGKEGYAKRVDRMVELAQYMTNIIKDKDELELLAPTTYCNVNFRFKGSGDYSTDEINQINLEARDRLYKSGKALFNFCHLGENISIRYVVANPALNEELLEEFLDIYLNKCREVENEIFTVAK